jgi:hypothetical protein
MRVKTVKWIAVWVVPQLFGQLLANNWGLLRRTLVSWGIAQADATPAAWLLVAASAAVGIAYAIAAGMHSEELRSQERIAKESKS